MGRKGEVGKVVIEAEGKSESDSFSRFS